MTTEETAHDALAEQLTEGVRTAIAEMWCDLLELDGIGPLDDFFALGGYSLLAIKVRAGIERRFGVALQLVDIFEHPVLTDLTELVIERMCAQLDPTDLTESTGTPWKSTMIDATSNVG